MTTTLGVCSKCKSKFKHLTKLPERMCPICYNFTWESFFKEKVLTLMSRPAVMKTLNNNKSMGKKSVPAEAVASQEVNGKDVPVVEKNNNSSTKTPKKAQNKVEMLHLKQKKRQIQLRLAYGAQQSSPEKLQKMLVQQNKKQNFLVEKIYQIVDKHEQRLMSRIKQRKMKTLAAKSQSNNFADHINEFSGHNGDIHFDFKQSQNETRQQDNLFNGIINSNNLQKNVSKQKLRKSYRSLSPSRDKLKQQELGSPLRRTISYNMAVHVNNQNIKMWNFQKNS